MAEWPRVYGDPDNRPLPDALVLARQVAARLPRPPRPRLSNATSRLPPGEVLAVGAFATALLLTVLEGPGGFPCAGVFGMPVVHPGHVIISYIYSTISTRPEATCDRHHARGIQPQIRE